MEQELIKNWLEEMPKLIYDLKFKYDFYWDGMYHVATKSIDNYIKPEKHRHKMIIYKYSDKFMVMVLYKKNGPKLLYTDMYMNDKTENRLWYSRKKLNKFYKKAEDERLYAIVEAAEKGCC